MSAAELQRGADTQWIHPTDIAKIIIGVGVFGHALLIHTV